VNAQLHDVNGKLTDGASRVFVNMGGHRTEAQIKSGTLSDGKLSYSTATGIKGSGTLTHAAGAMASVPLNLGGMSLAIDKGTLDIPTALFDYDGKALKLAGEISAEAKIKSGRFGAPGSSFNLAVGDGTTAKLRFANIDPKAAVSLDNPILVLGTVAKGTRTVQAKGVVVCNLNGGELVIPDPRGAGFKPVKLKVLPGTTGTVTLNDIERAAGSDFAQVRGRMSFHAKLTAAIPKGGITTDNFTIDRIASNSEDVRVNVSDLALENDGQFALGGIAVTEDTDLKDLSGTVSLPALPTMAPLHLQ